MERGRQNFTRTQSVDCGHESAEGTRSRHSAGGYRRLRKGQNKYPRRRNQQARENHAARRQGANRGILRACGLRAYPQGNDNSFLKSLKYAEEYYENQVPPAEIEPIEGDTVQEKSGQTKEEKKQQREESKKKRAEERQKKKEEREQRRKDKRQKIYKMNEGRRTRAKKGIILGAHMRQK